MKKDFLGLALLIGCVLIGFGVRIGTDIKPPARKDPPPPIAINGNRLTIPAGKGNLTGWWNSPGTAELSTHETVIIAGIGVSLYDLDPEAKQRWFRIETDCREDEMLRVKEMIEPKGTWVIECVRDPWYPDFFKKFPQVLRDKSRRNDNP